MQEIYTGNWIEEFLMVQTRKKNVGDKFMQSFKGETSYKLDNITHPNGI